MVVRALKDANVEHIFGYPGGSVLDIYDALFTQAEIEHILVRHEQAATHMADGYARATGKIGVVLATSGPGNTNCVTGVATAYMDSIPMLLLAGQVPTSLIGDDAFQETDIVGCCRTIVKHSFNVRNPMDIPKMIAKAIYIATTGRPGPVVVELPKDMVNPANKFPYRYPKDVSIRSYDPKPQVSEYQIEQMINAISHSVRPIIYTGGGVINGNCSHLLKELAERLNAPVVNTLMGLGGFPGTHKQFLGMLGMHGTVPANKAMAHADLIIALGARFDDRVVNNVKKFCPDARIIHVDIDNTILDKIVHAHISALGSVDEVIDQMIDMIDYKNMKTPARKDWWAQIEGWRKVGEESRYEESTEVIKPQTVIETLYKVTNGDAYLTSDVGQHQMFAALYYPFDKPRRWINSGGAGTMGFGLPAAMGVKMGHPDAEVCCITGDGSIQMNIQELSTCLQHDLPVKIISLNNRSLGMVRQWQDIMYEKRHSHSYMDSLPDFVKLAEAYGHVGIRIEKLEDLESGLAHAMSLKDRVVFVDIVIDETEHVYPMQVRFGAVDEMWVREGEKI